MVLRAAREFKCGKAVGEWAEGLRGEGRGEGCVDGDGDGGYLLSVPRVSVSLRCVG